MKNGKPRNALLSFIENLRSVAFEDRRDYDTVLTFLREAKLAEVMGDREESIKFLYNARCACG